jgi:hypothetical protein
MNNISRIVNDQHKTKLSFEADDPTSGQLAVVVRDELYGVAWRSRPLSATGPAP